MRDKILRVPSKATSHAAASEQCVSRTADSVKPLPEKEISMKKPHKPATEAHLNGNGKEAFVPAASSPTDEPSASSKKKVVRTAKAKGSTKTGKRARRAPRAAPGSDTEKLVCRYCGSDDLAPSFIKRRDARCRACFKQRYGSTARDKNAARPHKVASAK